MPVLFDLSEIFFQLRHPVIEPGPETRELGWIMTALAKRLGSIPPIPQSLKEAARAGFPEGPDQAGLALKAILENRQGVWLGLLDPDRNLDFVATVDNRINFHDSELLDWMTRVMPQSEVEALKPDPELPLIMMAGWHMDTTANTVMRDPAWNKGRRVGCLAVHADDAENLGLADGDKARLTTKAGQVEVEVQISPFTRAGMVLMPQGFGLDFGREKVGVNVSDLTDAKHRDRLAGTPYHRRVLCRLEKL